MINSISSLHIQGYVNRLAKLNTFNQVLTEYKNKVEKVSVDKPSPKIQNVVINNKIEIYA